MGVVGVVEVAVAVANVNVDDVLDEAVLGVLSVQVTPWLGK